MVLRRSNTVHIGLFCGAFPRASKWTPEVHATRLLSLMTKKGFQVVGKLLIVGTKAPEIAELYRSTLQKTFGLSPEKAFALVCNRLFDSSKEDIHGYSNHIRPEQWNNGIVQSLNIEQNL